MSLPFWRAQLILHDHEWATIAPNGDVRVAYASAVCAARGHHCDRCGASMLNPDGTVRAVFAMDRPAIGYIECLVCHTRNTRTLLSPGPRL